jgi:hypothetical protein
MIPVEFIVAFAFLVVLSILDFKTYNLEEGFIPSALTTSFIIVAFMSSGALSIVSGAFAFLLGMLLVDLNLYRGVADWKVFVACGFTMPTFVMIASFGFLLSLTGFGYKYLVKHQSRIKGYDVEIPFIPAILFAYALTVIIFIL